jgi:type II secretory pathway predicted ATPase ExeA
MYETYFNLTERPFGIVPRLDQYYPAASIEAARTTLARCLERAEGVALAIGPSGTGKTLLCQLLAEQLRGSFQVALLSNGRLSARRALLQAILYELGQPYRGLDEGELRLALAEYATLSDQCPQGIVLLVDEAHALPLRLLDEVHALTNLTHQGQPAVRLMLAGNRGLEERLANPKLDSLNQRLAARCYLEALNRAETQEYIHARVATAGGKGPRLIPAEACAAAYKATDGVPRLINQVCDHALLLAYAGGKRQLDAALVEEAWADLQQLPTPWNERPQTGGDVIEFGGLDDEPTGAAGPNGAKPSADADAESDAATASLHILSEDDEADAAGSNATPELDVAEVGGLEPADQVLQIQEMLTEAEQEFCPAGQIGPEVELVFDQPEHPFQEPFVQEEVIADRYATTVKGAGPSPAPAVPWPAAPLPVPATESASVAEQSFGPQQGAEQTAAPPWTGDARTGGQENGDESDKVEAWPACSVAPVQRHTYQRLFARLRNG